MSLRRAARRLRRYINQTAAPGRRNIWSPGSAEHRQRPRTRREQWTRGENQPANRAWRRNRSPGEPRSCFSGAFRASPPLRYPCARPENDLPARKSDWQSPVGREAAAQGCRARDLNFQRRLKPRPGYVGMPDPFHPWQRVPASLWPRLRLSGAAALARITTPERALWAPACEPWSVC